MSIWMIILLSFGLATDAFAVSVSNSLCFDGMRRRDTIFVSFMFGVFQGAMPLIGYVAGNTFSELVSQYDHWIALILLGFIGGKMLFDAIREWNEPSACPVERRLTFKMIIVQAIATSIDALAVGVSFAAIANDGSFSILFAVSMIAIITFICCVIGHIIGRKVGGLLGNWAQIFGGVVLLGIGLKIFVEHMTAAGAVI